MKINDPLGKTVTWQKTNSVSYQAIRAARMNPVTSLRTE